MQVCSQDGSSNKLKNLDDLGYELITFPENLREAFRKYICHFSGKLYPIDQRELTEAISHYSDDEFLKKFAKSLRYFPDEIAIQALSWVESLALFLGGAQTGINYISCVMREDNPDLHEQTLDCFWRCVRPNKPDVGYPHRDSTVWKMTKGGVLDPLLPFDCDERWKIWIPLYGCDRANSLELVPKSHKMEVPTCMIETENGKKPSIDSKWVDSHEWICPFTQFNRPQAVLFHDDLVHRGPVNLSPLIRFSAEFTMLLKY